MSLAPQLVTYVSQAFPNASNLLQDIISKYASQMTACAAFGLAALWEFVYDRLFEQDPDRIAITAAGEKITEEAASSQQSGSFPNGYSAADKKMLEEILENATKEVQKNSLQQFRKNGTLEDAKKDFDKLSGNTEEKKPKVWVKTLPYGKSVTVREKSLFDAKATIEIQKPNTSGAMRPIIKIRYV